jgi:hypothetical protein
MAANIVESANLLIRTPHDDDGTSADIQAQEAACLRQLKDIACKQPIATEHDFHVELVAPRLDIEGARQADAAAMLGQQRTNFGS